MIFKISDDKKYIVLDEDGLGEKGATWEDFKAKLPDNDARCGALPAAEHERAETAALRHRPAAGTACTTP